MKVIQINASYKPAFVYGGPTMSVSKLSEVLVSKDINLEVLTTCANGEYELDVALGKTHYVDQVPVTYYKRLTKDHTHFSPSLYIALAWKLARNKKAEGKTLVHIHTWWNLVSVFSCLIAIFHGASVTLSPRGTLSSYSFSNKNDLIKNIIFRFSKYLFKRCHFHATSENEKNAILKIIKPKSISVIPNLVNLPDNYHETPIQRNEVFNLLFLSRIEEKKGLEFFFSSLENLQVDYHLSIAGSGDVNYINQLKNHAGSLGIANKITWLGHLSSDTKFDVIYKHDLLVLPSYDENFANVIVESLAMGTAVLVTENVGLSDYVSEHNFGWVCKLTKKDICKKLEDAFQNKERLQRIRLQAPVKVRADFSDEKLSWRYIDMYKMALNS